MLNGQKKPSHTHALSFPFLTIITELHSKTGAHLTPHRLAPANGDRKGSAPLLLLKPVQIFPSVLRKAVALDKSISSLIALQGTVLNYCFSLLMCFLADPAVR